MGVILIYRHEVRPFTDRQIKLLETFADQAVIAIETCGYLTKFRRVLATWLKSLQQQTATADVLKVISRSAFDLNSVLDTLVSSAARLCDADGCVIFQRDGDVYRFRCQLWLSFRIHGICPCTSDSNRPQQRDGPRGTGRKDDLNS